MEFKRDKNGYIKIVEGEITPQYSSDFRTWFYFEKDGERYFFKGSNQVTNVEYEVLAGYIANQVGLNAVKYFPAVFVDKNGDILSGVVSKDFTNDGQCIRFNSNATQIFSKITDSPNTIENQMAQLEIFVKGMQQKYTGDIIFDKRKIQNELFKMLIFDTFMLNTDRARRNIEFLAKKVANNTYNIELAPIFDNSQIFATQSLKNSMQILDCIENKKPVPKEIFEKTDFLLGLNQCMDFDSLTKKISQTSMLNPYIKFVIEKFKNLDIQAVANKIKSENPNFEICETTLQIASAILDGTIRQNPLFAKRKFAFEF